MEARSASTRRCAEAESLKKAWDLLDYLPRPPEATPGSPSGRCRGWTPITATTGPGLGHWLVGGSVWGLALILFAVIGYLGFSWAYPPEPERSGAGPRPAGDRETSSITTGRVTSIPGGLDDPDLFGDVTSP